jgi:anti-sigma regulatory factor (Ser/Thr protein kinase)
MTIAATETMSLIAFTMPGTPYSVRMARFYVRATLDFHDLGDYADDAETVTSELVSNAIAHASAPRFDLEIMRLEGFGAVAVIVTDPSPRPPVKHHSDGFATHGRGLIVVEALSARWGWRPKGSGKAVYAILTREA